MRARGDFQNASAAFPDIPAVAEVVSGYEANQWFGIVAPKGTAPEIVQKLNNEINAGLADAQLQARLIDLGQTVERDPRPSSLNASQPTQTSGPT